MKRQTASRTARCNRYLSPAEHAALQAYAAIYGRTWKQSLRDAWMSASEPGILQQLRNASYFGPAGLSAYQLPGQQVTR